MRLGDGRAREGLPARQRHEIALLLRLRPELEQKLAGAKRVRHHDRDRERDRAGRNEAHDFGMRQGGKAEAAIGFRDDHAEEAVPAHEIPGLVGQVSGQPVDAPVVDHVAECAARTVEKTLFFGVEPGRSGLAQPVPVRAAGKEIGLPPDLAGVQRLLLGPGKGR